MGFGFDGGAGDAGVAADEAVLDAGVYVFDDAVFENHRMFDFAVFDVDVVVDAGVGADVAVDENFAETPNVLFSFLLNAAITLKKFLT